MRKSVDIIICALAFAILMGCSSAKSEKHSCTVLAMDTVMTLTVYGDKWESSLQSAQSLIQSLDSLLSVSNEESDTSRVNAGAGTPVTVSDTTMELLKDSLAMGDSTEGALDITLTPVIEAWGFVGGDYRVPSDDELAELLKNVDYSKVSCDEAAGTVTVPEGMAVSFGSTAKGMTGDLVTKQLRDNGVTSAIISLGGNVQALGLRPDGTKWNVALQSPFGEGYLGSLRVEDKAVITSGGYERYFQDDEGNIYWHILDPTTGKPAKNGLVSVTIVCDSGVAADGLSTALFVMGLDKATEYWRKNGGFDAVFVTDDEKVYVTVGIAGEFELDSEYSDLELTTIQ